MEENNQEDIIINSEKAPKEVEKSQKLIKKALLFTWDFVKIAVIAFVIVLPIRYFLFQPFIVSGASMAPSFASGDYLIVDEISYRFSTPQRGDVVVFNASFIPEYSGERFIKRVIGVPGDTVNIVNGTVEIIKGGNKTVVNEKYIPRDVKTYGYGLSSGYSSSLLAKEITLKQNEYFVLGDNRLNSYDSRFWGVVPVKYIIGKAALRILPITSLSEITRPSY